MNFDVGRNPRNGFGLLYSRNRVAVHDLRRGWKPTNRGDILNRKICIFHHIQFRMLLKILCIHLRMFLPCGAVLGC